MLMIADADGPQTHVLVSRIVLGDSVCCFMLGSNCCAGTSPGLIASAVISYIAATELIVAITVVKVQIPQVLQRKAVRHLGLKLVLVGPW